MTVHDTLARSSLPYSTGREKPLPQLPVTFYRSGPVAAVVVWTGLYLALSALLRGVLLFVYRGEIHDSLLQQLKAPLVGLGMDLVTLGYILPVVVLWMVMLPRRWQEARWVRAGRLGFFSLSLFGLLYLFTTEFYFFEEFLARFNYIAVEYLISPSEVFGNIWEFYPVIPVLVACALLTVGIAWSLRRTLTAPPTAQWNRRSRLLTLTAVLVLTAVGSQVGMSNTLWSRDRLLNEISNNGLFGFFYSFRTAGLDYGQYYLTLQPDQMWAQVHARLGSGEMDQRSTRREVTGNTSKQPWNVVFVIEESLGSEFSAALGGRYDATPELDALIRQGLLFDNVFATGNRTIRGLEASLASLPPLPGRSVIKRDKSEHVETLARVLQRVGYQTSFVYGGRGIFDGMSSFLQANGFDRFIEQKDFSDDEFRTAWGVSDEAVFDRALAEMDRQYAVDQPFFTAVLTVSNHKPFTYPEGRIDADPARRKRINAVRYADYALGRFFRQAATHPFFDRTLFVIFGDHGARVYGAELIPLPSYRVPLLMLGPPVAAGVRQPILGSSMDITPTVLDLLGLPYESVFYGKSLVANPPSYNFVLMQHNRNLALYDGHRLVVLGLRKTSQAFTVRSDDTLEPIEVWDPELLGLRDSAVAFFESAYELYDERRYRVTDG